MKNSKEAVTEINKVLSNKSGKEFKENMPVKEYREERSTKGFQGDTTDSTSINNLHDIQMDQETLKEGTVQFQSVNRILKLTKTTLRLNGATEYPAKKRKRHNEVIEIPWQDVIYAQMNTKVNEDIRNKCFIIHYMLQQKKRLRTKTITITTKELAANWIQIIEEQCSKVKGRPRKVFVLVNPIGGGGNAVQIYQKKVSPIFELAQIDADVFYTERSKHAIEIGERQDFSAYDGVIIVGGDGLYQEILHGMTLQIQRSAGVDYDDVNSKFECLKTPIGIIPAGTGNGVSLAINGLTDAETATLRVLKGEIHRSQVLTVYSNGKFFSISGFVFAYGCLADLTKRTGELRWMKQARYMYCMIEAIIKKKRETHCALEYLLAPASKIDEGNNVLNQKTQGINAGRQWIKHDSQGKDYASIHAFNAFPIDMGDCNGFDLFTNRIRLYADTGCKKGSFVKTFMKTVEGKKLEPLPENMHFFDVQGLRIKIIPEEGSNEESMSSAMAKAKELEFYVNIDGECLKLEIPELDARIVPSFVPLYACKW